MKKQRSLPRLLRVLPVYKTKMSLSITLDTLTIVSSVGLMATAAWLISKAALRPSIAALGLAPVAVRFFGITRALFRYSERLVTHGITFHILARLRVWFYTAIEPLAPARLAQFRSGDLLQRIVTDIEELENVYSRVLAPPVVAVLVTGLTALFLSAFDLAVAFVLLAFMLLAAITVPAFAWWIGRKPGQTKVDVQVEINETLVDGIQGVADSIAFNHVPTQLDALTQYNDRLSSQEKQLAWWDSIQGAVTLLWVNLAALVVLIVAIPRVDGIYLGLIVLATLAAFEAIIPLGQAMHQLGTNLAAGKRLFEIIDAQPVVMDPQEPSPTPVDYSIHVENLTFRYAPGEPPVFQNFDFHVASGDHIVVLGASGRGKSTLIQLLLRFWEFDRGQILLGGQNLRHFRQADLHNIFGVMTQRTHLFNTTIWENIHLANREASEEQVILAAKRAQIHGTIMAFPAQYQTLVGETGVNLSGGERQRVALARVILKDSPIWLLDEATANLDAVTERALLETIEELAAGRTMLMMTHRGIGTGKQKIRRL